MDNNPKRRKSKDNPYTIYIIDNKYIVEFKDCMGVIQKVDVSKDVYESFNSFELIDKKQMNEFDNHIERNEVYEETLYKRANLLSNNLEDDVIKKTEFELLRNAINKLPDIQKRRIKMYYFEEINVVDIAKSEGTTHQAISKSLREAIRKLNKILKS